MHFHNSLNLSPVCIYICPDSRLMMLDQRNQVQVSGAALELSDRGAMNEILGHPTGKFSRQALTRWSKLYGDICYCRCNALDERERERERQTVGNASTMVFTKIRTSWNVNSLRFHLYTVHVIQLQNAAGLKRNKICHIINSNSVFDIKCHNFKRTGEEADLEQLLADADEELVNQTSLEEITGKDGHVELIAVGIFLSVIVLQMELLHRCLNISFNEEYKNFAWHGNEFIDSLRQILA